MPYPPIHVIDAAPAWLLRLWWRSLPAAKTNAEKDLAERLAIRVEGEGWIPEEGA